MNLFTSLLAYYKLDTVSGQVDLSDATGRQSPLTNYGSVASATGKINGCALFNGSNQYLTGPSNLVYYGDFSVSLWLKANNVSNAATAFESDGKFNIWFSNGKLNIDNTQTQSDIHQVGNISTNTWYHVCVVNNSGTTSLYLNGYFLANTTQGLSLGGTIHIGGYIPFNVQYLNGNVDEIGIWNRALSVAEVNQLYNSGSGNTYIRSLISDGYGSTCYPDQIDCSGYCNGLTVFDCSGVCGGSSVLDTCGVCAGGCTQDCSSGYCGGGYGGCTDANACNYDPNASYDNGSCAYSDACGNCGNYHGGCTYYGACNYDSCANYDDGSCVFTADACGNCGNYHGGCTDPSACANYDSCANYDDGSCQYDYGCGCYNGWNGSLPAASQVLTGVTYSEGQFSYTGTLQPGVPKSKVILSAALGIPIT